MGLQSNQGSGVFLSISNGKLVRQFKQATDHSVSRVNKAGKEVHEEFYDSLIGQIKDIKTKESEYGGNSGYRDWETDRKSTRLNSSHRL